MPEETGVMGFRPLRALLPDIITLPQHFRDSGYETAAAGKFHDKRTVGTIVDPDSPTTGGSSTDDLLSWSLPYVSGGTGYTPPTAASGKKYATNSNTLATDPTDQLAYTDGKILTAGLSLIDQVSQGSKPFFVSVGFKKPHLPFVAPKAYWDLYNPANAPIAAYEQLPVNATTYNAAALGDNGELRGYEPYATNYASDTTVTPTTAEKRDLIHGYYASTSFVDYLVGQLTAKLAATADPVQTGKMMNETTIIVIWGDHGFALGQHGKWAKHTNMEQSSSCPLIIFDPRTPTTGATTKSPAQTVDIYPTLCHLAQLSIPTQPQDETTTTGRPLSGRSLVPVINDPTSKVAQGAITQISRNGGLGYAYRTEKYRYIEWVNKSGVVIGSELYDYSIDPNETRAVYRTDTSDSANNVTDAAYETIAYALSRSLRAEVSTQGTARFWDSDTDTYSSGPNRLQNSTPLLSFETIQQSYVHSLRLEPLTNNTALLSWSAVGNSTYKVTKNTDLSSTWNLHQDYLNTTELTINSTLAKEFFRVQLSDNDRPVFSTDPIVKADAASGSAYSGNIASDASDPNTGDTITFSKVSGPAWLSVASDGTLSGTPAVSDECPNYFTVRATDNHGASTDAILHINVTSSAVATVTTDFTSTHDTYAKQTAPTTNYGTSGQIQLREESGSNFARLGFVQFNVTGTTNITSAKLYLYSVDEGDTVNAHLTTNGWTETNLNWSNKPATGALAGSATATAGAWFSIDVTASVTANGTYSFVIDEKGDTPGKLNTSNSNFAPYLKIIHQ